MNISQRSYKKELLDDLNTPFADIKKNMEELDFINTYLGGHNITLSGLKNLLTNTHSHTSKCFVICEVGCGGGDNMLAIHRWCKKKNIDVHLIGIDINANCIEVAVSKFKDISSSFITSDYIDVTFEDRKPDYIFSSLFCHHFTDEQLVEMLGWMNLQSQVGFFINDLHRHKLAYYSILFLTKLFSRSYLVKNDAPLSVLRGFTKSEWKNLLNNAGIRNYNIQWKWAFRHLVTITNANNDNNETVS